MGAQLAIVGAQIRIVGARAPTKRYKITPLVVTQVKVTGQVDIGAEWKIWRMTFSI